MVLLYQLYYYLTNTNYCINYSTLQASDCTSVERDFDQFGFPGFGGFHSVRTDHGDQSVSTDDHSQRYIVRQTSTRGECLICKTSYQTFSNVRRSCVEYLLCLLKLFEQGIYQYINILINRRYVVLSSAAAIRNVVKQWR